LTRIRVVYVLFMVAKQRCIRESSYARCSNRLLPAQLVDTTVELANKVGAAEIISRIVDDLKDEAEQYRKMVMETIEKIMGNLGAADIDHKLEEQLIDGILYAFQEQTTEVSGSTLPASEDSVSFPGLFR